MKRKTVKSLLCAALMALTLSATACGGSDDGAKSANAETATEAPAAEEASVEAEEEEAPAEEKSSGQKTLEEYLKEDPTAEQQLKEQAAQGNDQMDMAIEVKGNEFLCIATYKDSVELPDDVSDQLSEGMDAMGGAFSAIAGALDEGIGAEKGTVSYGIRYCAPDGTVLAEASFRAE